MGNDFLQGLVLGTGVMAITFLVGTYNKKEMPDLDEAQAGYVATSNIKIEAQDFDGIEGLETILRIDNKPYGLIYNAEGQPELVPYRILEE